MRKIKVVIIGMGIMGKIRYNAMKTSGKYEIMALCDNNIDNLNCYDEEKYENWKECIDNTSCEAVLVCTYNDIVVDIVCYSLSHNYAVFSEKPPGRNIAETMRMKEVFDTAKNPILKFGFNHRYHNSVIEAKALINSGILGEIVCARGVYGKAGNANFTEEWRNNTRISGGGIMLDQGIHMLDLIYYFMGEITEVQSSVDQLVWKNMPTEDSAFSILKTKNGKVASLHSSAIQWRHKFHLELICTNGYISLEGLRTSSNSYGNETISYYVKDLETKTGKLGQPIKHFISFDSDSSWDFEMNEFYDCAVNGKEVEVGSIYDAVNVMSVIESIYCE